MNLAAGPELYLRNVVVSSDVAGAWNRSRTAEFGVHGVHEYGVLTTPESQVCLIVAFRDHESHLDTPVVIVTVIIFLAENTGIASLNG